MKEKIKTLFGWAFAALIVWMLFSMMLGAFRYAVIFNVNQQAMTNLRTSCDGQIMFIQWKYGCAINGANTSCQVMQCVQTK